MGRDPTRPVVLGAGGEEPVELDWWGLEMSTELFQPFLEGAVELLEGMLGITGNVLAPENSPPTPFVSGIIQISGDVNGQLALSFPEDTGKAIAAAMLDMEPGDIDDEILADGVGEITNLVVGQAKTLLNEQAKSFKLGVPTIVMGQGHRLEMFQGAHTFTRRVTTDQGDFAITLWLSER